ncbi:MAG: SpaH/EbpB family LPXTG-anchored major pilin [Microbacteriaceae bacterium]|nr:SpaH/EbpB family LPXTG-anchored major pilin [Microbacteriaceae bacterium]
MNNSLTRLPALGAALTAAVLAAVALGGPASAATPLPDGTQKASLNITKYDTTGGIGSPADGTQASKPAGTNTLDGVTFTVQQVNTIDLTTQAGWDAAGNLATTYNSAAPTGNAAAQSTVTGAGYTLGTAQSQVTANGGIANFTGLPLGVYLVEETAAPAGVVPAAPFLVTLPMTDPSSTSAWNYNVYVYPKNAVTSATKTVNDAGAHALGDAVVFTVTGAITPATGSDPNAALTGYEMSDSLDAKLTYSSSTVALADGTAVPAADYTIDASNPSGTPGVTVIFNAAGLAFLGQHRTTQVVWTISTTANATGDIHNTAYLYPDSSAVNGTTQPVPTTTVDTKWGGVEVLKQNQATPAAALAGATFQVYATNSASIKPVVGTDTPLSIDGTSSWVTGANGLVTIDGLRYSDFANNATVADGQTGYNYYWLVETKAPAGYELQAEPIGFTVEGAAGTTTPDITVTDVPHNAGFQLPFTGGTGTTVVTIAGLGTLVAAALVAALVAWRRRRSAEPAQH